MHCVGGCGCWLERRVCRFSLFLPRLLGLLLGIVTVVAAAPTQPLVRHSAPLYYHLQTYLTTSTIDTILRKRPRIQHNRRHLWPILCRHLLPKLRRSTCPKHTRHGPREKSQVFKYLSGIKDSSVDNVDLNLTKYLNGPTTPNERNKVSTVKGV